MGLFSFLTQEIAIDLGTANTIIIHNDKIVVDEPSIVAVDKNTNKLIAIGEKARQMHGKTHENIRTIRPLRDGVIADFNAAILTICLCVPALQSTLDLMSSTTSNNASSFISSISSVFISISFKLIGNI